MTLDIASWTRDGIGTAGGKELRVGDTVKLEGHLQVTMKKSEHLQECIVSLSSAVSHQQNVLLELFLQTLTRQIYLLVSLTSLSFQPRH